MKIAVIGLGSMGKRRLRLLRQYIERESKQGWQLFGVDAREDRRREAESLYGIRTFVSLAEALLLADAVVVSTSPLAHAAIIRECLLAGRDVFTELNLVADGYEENMRLAWEHRLVLFLSSTFLYRKDVRYVIEAARAEKMPLNYMYHVGQYLPDWHPWESVADYFVGQARTNGCRELLAIELPWLIAAFGQVVGVRASKSRNTQLPLGYDNNYLLLLEHEDAQGRRHKGALAIDVMSRKAVRNLEVFNEHLYLSWDGTPQGLRLHDNESGGERTVELYEQVEHQEGYSSFVVENAYGSELEAFIRAVEQRDLAAGGAYGFAEDLRTLAMIDRIEAADE